MINNRSRFAFVLALVIHTIAMVSLYFSLFHRTSGPIVPDVPVKLALLNNQASPYQNHEITTQMPSKVIPKTAQKNVSNPQKASSYPSDNTDTETALPDIPSTVQELIDRHYGSYFMELTKEEQLYVIANIATIHKIDRQIGNDLIADKPRNTFKDGETNVVEFYLYPNGMISDIEIIGENRSAALDDVTMQTIEESYGRYPRPNQKTLIRIQTKIVKL